MAIRASEGVMTRCNKKAMILAMQTNHNNI